MMFIRRLSIGAAVAALVVASAFESAVARTVFDGTWNIRVTTTRGACDQSTSFNVQIYDGIVQGQGGFPVQGRVSPSGAVRVSIHSGNSHANGSGRLRGGSGGGSWRGSGSRGVCSGSWSASR
jgi:hypothetical protein